MIVLGIETATMMGSVALVGEKGVVAQYSLNIEVGHSERVMVAIDRVLADAGVGLKELDGIAISIGPGSFTGLRIGLSTAKGLSLATGKPLAPVRTLEALAWNLPFARSLICPILDARKKEVYTAIFKSIDGELKRLTEDMVRPIKRLLTIVKEPAIFLGDAVEIYRSVISEELGGMVHFAPRSLRLPSAAVVAELGMKTLQEGKGEDPYALVPLYIRPSEAETMWEKRKGKVTV